MFREWPGPLGNDRNAENFRLYLADQGKKVWAQGRGGAFRTPQFTVTSGHEAGLEASLLWEPCPVLLTWAQRPLGKMVVVYQMTDMKHELFVVKF